MASVKTLKPLIEDVVRAIDLGFGNTKYTFFNKEKNVIECRVFPSLAPRSSKIDLGDTTALIEGRDTRIAEVNGAKYEIGPDSKDLITGDDVRVLNDNYIFSDQYLALFKGALSYMDETSIDYLIVGLPVSNMRNSKKLEELLIGEHEVYNKKGELITVMVKDVCVWAQPLGGLFDYARPGEKDSKYEEIKNETNLIIDPGFLTFDFLVSKGIRIVENRSGALPGGVSRVLNNIAKSITEKVLNNEKEYKNLVAIDEGLRSDKNEIKIAGNRVNLEEHKKAAIPAIEDSINFMLNIVGNDMDIDNIILVGGGAKIFEKTLDKIFKDRTIIIQEESVFSNLIGFYIAGVQKYMALKKKKALRNGKI